MTATDRRHVTRRARHRNEIHHVHILSESGDVLADVDAASTADGLAYYLRSRQIDDTATEATVWHFTADPFTPLRPKERIVFRRTRWDGLVEVELIAQVH